MLHFCLNNIYYMNIFGKNIFSKIGIVVLLIALLIIGCALFRGNIQEGLTSRIQDECSDAYWKNTFPDAATAFSSVCNQLNDISGAKCTSDITGSMCTNIGITEAGKGAVVGLKIKQIENKSASLSLPTFSPSATNTNYTTYMISDKKSACTMGATEFKGAPITCPTT